MAVKIGSARIDERGRTYGGKAGDQGSEVSRQNWYKHAKGWVVLRPKSSVIAYNIAFAMKAACANSKIGYDQHQRNTLYNQVKPFNFDPSKAITACETDCSALVRVCCAYAGVSVGDFTTANQVSVLMATGKFDKLTASKYTTISTYLQSGDILVTKTQGHTVVVLSDGDGVGHDYQLGDRVLSKGVVGTDVEALQEALISLGHDVGACGADGDFGNDTQAAVEAFQGAHGLARDGIYGSETHKSIVEALNDETDDDAPDDSGEDGGDDDPDDSPIPRPSRIIDISRWNGKIKDIEKLKAACDFVIHRASCGTTKDAVLDYNAALMRAHGVPFGVYHYIQAVNADDARKEARVFYQSAMPYSPKFWTLDCEYSKITAAVRKKGSKIAREIVAAFVDELAALGVKRTRIGCYIGHHLYKLWNLDYSIFAFIWIPRYGSNNGQPQTKPAYPCDLWQYTSVGQCPGIADKTVDLNQLTGKGKDSAWFRGE